jgi:hypothetical protein
MFRNSYPRLPEWQASARLLDGEGKFQSNLSERLRISGVDRQP